MLKFYDMSYSKYNYIGEFHEGLARVKNREQKWGYINKNGKRVIACKYKFADDFSEGLAGVIDEDYNYYYIDKCGRKKIEISRIYTSLLELGDKYIFIKASSEEELNEKNAGIKASKRRITR